MSSTAAAMGYGYDMGAAGVSREDVFLLVELAREMWNLQVAHCNRNLTARELVRESNIQDQLEDLCKRNKLDLKTDGDPRGPTVSVRGRGLAGGGWYLVA